MTERDYTDADLEASLRRAFVDKRWGSILFDGHIARNQFLRDGVELGERKGWLNGEFRDNEREQ